MILSREQKKLYKKMRTKLQRAFVDEYISQDKPNQTRAYLAACKAIKMKPARNPTTAASTLLTNPNVSAFIETTKQHAAEAAQVSAEYVLRRLKEIDELDVIDILNDDLSGFKPVSEWPKVWRISISGVDIQQMGSADSDEKMEMMVKKIKWPDKTKNLELLGKHVGVQAFKEKIEHEASDDLIHLIQAGRGRVNGDTE